MPVPQPNDQQEQNLVCLTDAQLEAARRAVLYELKEALERSSEQVAEAAEQLWPPSIVVEDARCSLAAVDRLVAAMDGLGWPRASR